MMYSDYFLTIYSKIKKLKPIVEDYNLFDLVQAVFCINIFINNRCCVESSLALNASIIDHSNNGKIRIKTYEDFKIFFKKIENVLKPNMYDDLVVKDFGEVKIKFKGKTYNVIIGTGHNLVFGVLNYLPYLAKEKGKERELEVVLKYFSNMIDYFKNDNKYNGTDDITFEIPTEKIFYRTKKYFNEYLKNYDLIEIYEILYRDNLPVEKVHFAENGDNIYPLLNLSILIDLFEKWYIDFDKQEQINFVNNTIVSLLNNLLKLDQRKVPNVLFPVKLAKDGKIIENLNKYTFMAHCDKGTIIAINRDMYEINDEIKLIEKFHKNNELQFIEMKKRYQDKKIHGVTILKEEPIKFILYDSFVNISEGYFKPKKLIKDVLTCTALDMIYYLNFMDDFNELYDYILYDEKREFDKIISFGGDATKFLFWKEQGHVISKGALKYSVIDIGYNTENDYVVEYYKDNLEAFPWALNDFIFDYPFAWKIEKEENGFYQYVNKYALGIGGLLKLYKNNCFLFFMNNLEFYIQSKNIDIELIKTLDNLNMKLIKDCENAFEDSESLSNKGLQIIYMPKDYAQKVGLYINFNRKYVYSDMVEERNKICIRYTVDKEKLYDDMYSSKDRTTEVVYFKEIFEPLQNKYPLEYKKICERLDLVKNNKKKVSTQKIEIDYVWNEIAPIYNVKEKAYLDVRKNIAYICYENGIEPNEYYGEDANKVIRSIQKILIEDFENKVRIYNMQDLHCRILDIYSTVIHNININKKSYVSFGDIDEGVLQDIQESIIEKREEDKHHARSLQYLIETNLFIQRDNGNIATEEEIEFLLAYANWLVVLTDNADICHFTDKETHIQVNDEYLIDVLDNEHDIDEIVYHNKRIYSDKGYEICGDEVDLEYIEKLKKEFLKDTLINLVDLYDFMDFLQYLKSDNVNLISTNVYEVNKDLLIEDFIKFRESNIQHEEVEKIILFLSIKPESLKVCKGKEEFYLAIGERKNRDCRFDVKPLFMIEDKIIFSPITIKDIHDKWFHGLLDFYPPYEVGIPRTKKLLDKWKKYYEDKIVYDIEKVFQDYNIDLVKTNLELYKIDKENRHPRNLGDYDVFAIDSKHCEIWMLECKVLEKVGSFYEMYRQQNRFFYEHKKDEKFQRRIDYMKQNYKLILNYYNKKIKKCNFDLEKDYKIIPYMVMNKVMISRYKDLKFEIISYSELVEKIERHLNN